MGAGGDSGGRRDPRGVWGVKVREDHSGNALTWDGLRDLPGGYRDLVHCLGGFHTQGKTLEHAFLVVFETYSRTLSWGSSNLGGGAIYTTEPYTEVCLGRVSGTFYTTEPYTEVCLGWV